MPAFIILFLAALQAHRPPPTRAPYGAHALASDGYVVSASEPLTRFAAFAPLAGGDRIVFEGTRVVRVPAGGAGAGAPSVLAQWPAFVFPSFVLVEPDERFAIVGESTNNELWRVDLVQGGKSLLANVVFNFDAVFDGHARILVSAATCGWSCGNDLVRVDLQSGAASAIGHVGGPSGPLAFVRGGDLVYGRQSDAFPAPEGSVALLVWRATTIASGAPLTEANAEVFASGLDGAQDVAFDERSGLVFVATSSLVAESRILAFDLAGQLVAEVAHGSRWLGQLAMRDVAGDGTLAPYDAPGAELWCSAADFATAGGDLCLRLEPRRATAATSGPGLSGPGLVRCDVGGAARLGRAWLLLAPRAAFDASEPRASLFGWTVPLAAPPGSWHRLAMRDVDAHGRVSFEWHAPAGAQGTHVVQALHRRRDGRAAGTSTPAFD